MMNSFMIDRNRPRRVVFYGRVSTEHEAQLSALENQMQWYDDIAKRFPNWEVAGRYIDEGITGTQAKKRPSFMQMIADSHTNKFDLIVTREVCRFARNTVDTLNYTRDLRNRNIEVYFVDDNIWTMDGDGELRLAIMATLAQEESRKVSERVKAGQRISRENKVLYGNGNILGYERKAGETYTVNPEQAETVRMIYDLYEQGYGTLKIAKIMQERKRLTAAGTTKWTVSIVRRVINNATYKGYICYNKSHSNNYLDQKRINNNDKDTYVYVKGDFEPIVTEEQWDKCQEILKSKRKITLVENGEVKKVSNRTSSDIWVRKLRCSCGSSFRKNRYHKNKAGITTFNYICYNQVNNGKASFRISHGLDADGYCDEHSVTDWKMEMMSKLFIDKVWQSRKEDLLTAFEYIKKYYTTATRNNTEHSKMFMKAQVEKAELKIKNLVDLYADGQIRKEEFAEFKEKYNNELAELKAQQTKLGEQQETFESCIDDLTAVSQALDGMIDKSATKLNFDFIDKLVNSITVDKNRFIWNFNFRPAANAKTVMSIDGTKRRPVIYIDSEPCTEDGTGASTEDPALHICDMEEKPEIPLLPHENLTNRTSDKSSSLLRQLHRQLSRAASKLNTKQTLKSVPVSPHLIKKFISIRIAA